MSVFVWFLVFSTLVAALLPPLAHAYKVVHGIDETCDHFGIKLVQVPKLMAETGLDEADTHLEHCPFCTPHAVIGFPAALGLNRNVGITRTAFVPPLYLFAPARLFAWLIPSSRAPPFYIS